MSQAHLSFPALALASAIPTGTLVCFSGGWFRNCDLGAYWAAVTGISLPLDLRKELGHVCINSHFSLFAVVMFYKVITNIKWTI